MWFKIVILLVAVVLLSGCVSEKKENKQESDPKTEVSLNHFIISQNITAQDHYIVRLNTTKPIEASANEQTLIITIPKQDGKLTMTLFDIGKNNETYSRLENTTRRLISIYGWQDRKWHGPATEPSWYATLPSVEINEHKGVIATGHPKYEAPEVSVVYYPLPGVLMMVQSTFTKQETTDILNITEIRQQ